MRVLMIIFVSILLTSCNRPASTVKDSTINLKEGKLTYAISGDGTTSSWDLEILFNQNSAVIIEKYARGAGRKYVYDKKSNEILGLFDDVAIFGTNKEQYLIYYTPEELISHALSSNYGDTTITKTTDFKEILGYKCQKSIIKHGDQVTVEVWLTDKIKPGVIYPWTPLTFEDVALQYELKVLGRTERKYIIKSISDEAINNAAFEHKVPDDYHLVVPKSEFSIDTMWSGLFEENKFQSFTYPHYRDGRTSTIALLNTALQDFIKKNNIAGPIGVDFFINKDGTISDIEATINNKKKDERCMGIKRIIEGMPRWSPATVKGKAVKSKVSLIV